MDRDRFAKTSVPPFSCKEQRLQIFVFLHYQLETILAKFMYKLWLSKGRRGGGGEKPLIISLIKMKAIFGENCTLKYLQLYVWDSKIHKKVQLGFLGKYVEQVFR